MPVALQRATLKGWKPSLYTLLHTACQRQSRVLRLQQISPPARRPTLPVHKKKPSFWKKQSVRHLSRPPSFILKWQYQHHLKTHCFSPTRLGESRMCQSSPKEFLLCQTGFKKGQSSHTSLRHCLWFQINPHHWQIPLMTRLMPSSHSRESRDSLCPPSLQQLLPFGRKSTLHLSHVHQWCAQFLPTQRLPLRHQGWCLLPQRQHPFLPGVLPNQTLCLLLVKHQSQWSPLQPLQHLPHH